MASVIEAVKLNQGISYPELLAKVKGLGLTADDLNYLISRGTIYTDLRSVLLIDRESVTIFTDRITAEVTAAAEKSKAPSVFESTGPVDLTPTARILWRGEEHVVTFVSEKIVQLLSVHGQNVNLRRTDLELDICAGKVSGISCASAREQVVVNLLAQAGPERLQEAVIPMPSASTPTALKEVEADVSSVAEILARPQSSDGSWLVKNLIRDSDQVILAGSPKTGKSFLAMQLALTIAEGQDHLHNPFFILPEYQVADVVADGQFIPRPRKVLFFSFEMGASVIQSRLLPHLETREDADKERLRGLTSLLFTFSIDKKTSLSLSDPNSPQTRAVEKLISDHNPDLIIWDTLVQLHREEENDNGAMAGVLNRLRDLCKVAVELMDTLAIFNEARRCDREKEKCGPGLQ